jgi:hypothetical protein
MLNYWVVCVMEELELPNTCGSMRERLDALQYLEFYVGTSSDSSRA